VAGGGLRVGIGLGLGDGADVARGVGRGVERGRTGASVDGLAVGSAVASTRAVGSDEAATDALGLAIGGDAVAAGVVAVGAIDGGVPEDPSRTVASGGTADAIGLGGGFDPAFIADPSGRPVVGVPTASATAPVGAGRWVVDGDVDAGPFPATAITAAIATRLSPTAAAARRRIPVRPGAGATARAAPWGSSGETEAPDRAIAASSSRSRSRRRWPRSSVPIMPCLRQTTALLSLAARLGVG
jgi:hypothetical protein